MNPVSVDDCQQPEVVLAVQRAALAAVEPGAAVRRHVRRQGDLLVVGDRRYDLAAVERLWVVGGGKAATAMAGALHDLLGSRLAGGLVVTKHGHAGPAVDTGPVVVLEAGHPLPDEAGVAATQRLAEVLSQATARDLVLAVLSGGASALLTLPAEGLALPDLIATTDLLLRSGAGIVELNTVRKHLSRIKGGGLVRLAGGAAVVGLILSDVVGDPLETIASGPTTPDPTTYADAWAVLRRYGLVDRLPGPVRDHLRAGLEGRRPETLKPGASLFGRVHNVVIGSNRLAAEAAVEAARRQGCNALLLSTFVEGEAREVARVAAALAREVVAHGRPVPSPACLVWGGETTVTVRGQGKGGRNQELALAAALALDGLPGVLLAALGTDGTDGPTDAAGAVATGQTVARARALGLDARTHLDDNDAYPLFEALGDLIRTGPTGTNVNDLLFIFVFDQGREETMAKPKVFVTRIIPEGGLERIRQACDADVWPEELPPPREVLLQRVRGVAGIVSLLTDRIDAEVMAAAGPGLKVISNYAVGYDNLDVPAATARGIPLGNTPGVLTETTADMAFALLMAAARRIVEGADYVRAGRWRTWGPTLLLGHDVHGATLGIVGMGRIGQGVTRRAAGFDMRVLCFDPYCDAGRAPFVDVGVRTLDELLAESDFVSLHVPLSPETYHLVDARALALMKPTAVLINTSRGPVVDGDALYDALAAGQIAYAALDVTDPEPLPAGHRLYGLPNCLIVPHIASASWATRTRMAVMAADNLLAGLRGERLPNCINPEVYDAR